MLKNICSMRQAINRHRRLRLHFILEKAKATGSFLLPSFALRIANAPSCLQEIKISSNPREADPMHNVRASHLATLPNLIAKAALGDSSFALLSEIVWPIIAFIPHHREHTVT